MPNEPPDINEVNAIRARIDEFIQGRLAAKEKKIESEPEKWAAQRRDWIRDASRRAAQIKMASHAIKYFHRLAKGSSFYFISDTSDAKLYFVGTHSVTRNRKDDVVGNAAALDVFKFLSLEINGHTIMKRLLNQDAAVLSAFDDDQEFSSALVKEFLKVVQADGAMSSHSHAKQIYFPVNHSAEYHLLSPIFPSSLVHAVYENLREDRFSDGSKLARQARNDSKFYHCGYCEYPNLAAQVHGGSKPQNISQLNAERHGENWLLASLPPTWQSPAVRAPKHVRSIFGRYLEGRRSVREYINSLAAFLTSTDYNNVNIRRKRAELVNLIVDDVIQVVAELNSLPPGWSGDAECVLDMKEKLWLDTGRSALDEAFAEEQRSGLWRKEILFRFANWMNRVIIQHSKKRGGVPLGDVEHAEWQSVFDDALSNVKEELTNA